MEIAGAIHRVEAVALGQEVLQGTGTRLPGRRRGPIPRGEARRHRPAGQPGREVVVTVLAAGWDPAGHDARAAVRQVEEVPRRPYRDGIGGVEAQEPDARP